MTWEDGLRNAFGYRTMTEERLVNRIYRQGAIDSVGEVLFDNGQPVRYVQFIVRNGLTLTDSWYFVEYYSYEQERLAAIRRNEYWSGSRGSRHTQFQLSYDEKGKLVQILDGQDQPVYISMAKAEVAALREEVRAGLFEQAKQTITQLGELAAPSGEQACFAAIYLHDEPEAVCDPVFQLGLARFRTDQQANEEKRVKSHTMGLLWNSGEHPVSYQLGMETAALESAFAKLMLVWQVKGSWWKEGRKLWHEVAQALNGVDWRAFGMEAEDFVVYIDEEGLLAKKHLPLSIPAEKIVILQEKGLL